MQKPKVSILGCGWVGKALAKCLESDYFVRCSVSSKESLNRIKSSHKTILNMQNGYHDKEFFACDFLVISISAKNKYIESLQQIIKHIRENTHIILLSSISIYKGKQIIKEGEEILLQTFPHTLILRLGGLMGYDRIAGKYSQGATRAENNYVNYVHRDDIVRIIQMAMDQKITGEIFDVVAPVKVSQKELFDYHAHRYGFDKTDFLDSTPRGRQLSSFKLQKSINFSFQYDTLETICSTPL